MPNHLLVRGKEEGEWGRGEKGSGGEGGERRKERGKINDQVMSSGVLLMVYM